jgi:hypothetical protein
MKQGVVTVSGKPSQDTGAAEATREATGEADTTEPRVLLEPLTIEGENPACAQLRADVEGFLGISMITSGTG